MGWSQVSGRDWPQQSSATLRPASAQTSSRRSQAALGESAEPCLNARTEQAVPPCKQKEHDYELRYDSLDDLVRPLLDPRFCHRRMRCSDGSRVRRREPDRGNGPSELDDGFL